MRAAISAMAVPRDDYWKVENEAAIGVETAAVAAAMVGQIGPRSQGQEASSFHLLVDLPSSSSPHLRSCYCAAASSVVDDA